MGFLSSKDLMTCNGPIGYHNTGLLLTLLFFKAKLPCGVFALCYVMTLVTFVARSFVSHEVRQSYISRNQEINQNP